MIDKDVKPAVLAAEDIEGENCSIRLYGNCIWFSGYCQFFLPPSCRQYQFKKQCDVLFRLIHETLRHTLTFQGSSTFVKPLFPDATLRR